MVVRRNLAGHRTGGALVALFQVIASQRTNFIDKI
jgi:hypothetical protein